MKLLSNELESEDYSILGTLGFLSYEDQMELLMNLSGLINSDSNNTSDSMISPDTDQLINNIFSFVNDDAQGLIPESPSVMTYALIVLYIISFTSGIIGNFTALTVVFRCRQFNQTTVILLLSLLISDILVVTICIPYTILMHVNGAWVHGKVICKLLPFVHGTAIFAGMFVLFVLTAYQFLGRSHWHLMRHIFSGYGTGIIVLLCWAAGVILSSPLLYVTELRVLDLMSFVTVTMCQEMWPYEHSRHLYNVTVFMLTYLVPGTVFSLGYLKMLCSAFLNPRENTHRRQHNENKNASTDVERDIEHNKIPPNNAPDMNNIEELTNEVQTMTNQVSSVGEENAKRLLTWLVGIFALLWLPYHILIIYLDIHVKDQSVTALGTKIFPIAQWLALSTSAFRPICYCLFATDYRSQLKRPCCLSRTDARKSSRVSVDEGLFMQSGNFGRHHHQCVDNNIHGSEKEDSDHIVDVVTVL